MNLTPSRKPLFFFLLSIGFLVLFFHLGARDLWEPDETRYAVVAREMRETGNWVLPHLNGEVYAEKPPLFFWLVNLSTFFGYADNEVTNRLPSALAGLITILLTFLFGERLFNTRVGFLSGLVLTTCFLFPQLSRWMMLDSLLTLFFLLTLFCFYLGYEKEKRRRRYYVLAGLFIGLGVLTKGPIAYLPILIFLIVGFFQEGLKKFWNRDLLLGCLLSLVVVLIWSIPAFLTGGKDYFEWLLFQQAVQTYAKGGSHFHPQPFIFYFIRFPIEFFPWIVFLPSAFFLGLRKARDKRKELLFLSIWFLFIFLFFTLAKGKKDNYLLPLYPAAALIVGWLWDSWISSGEGRKAIPFGLLFLTSLFFVALVLIIIGYPEKVDPRFQSYGLLGISILSYLFIGGMLSILFSFKGKRLLAFMSLAVSFIIFHLHISYALPPQFNSQRSMRVFSEKVLKRMEAGDDLKTFRFKPSGLLYYARRPYIEEIRKRDRFFEIFNSSRRTLIIVHAEILNKLKKDSNFDVDPLERIRVGRWDLVLISNRDIQKDQRKEVFSTQ